MYKQENIYLFNIIDLNLGYNTITDLNSIQIDIFIGGTSDQAKEIGQQYSSIFPDDCQHRLPGALYLKNQHPNMITTWCTPNIWSDKNVSILQDCFPTNAFKEMDTKMILLIEPRIVKNMMAQYRGLNDYIRNNSSQFDLILTYDKELLKLPNSKLFLCGGAYVNDFEYETVYTKNFIVSMVCGWKNWATGHILRQNIWQNRGLLKVPLDFYYSYYGHGNLDIQGCKIFPPDSKFPIFEKAMFHITIENSVEENYFSEKLIDCFLTETVPIYWGCPNLGDFFDMDGVIVINDINDCIEKVNQLTVDDYNKRKDAIQKNKQIVLDQKLHVYKDRLENEYFLLIKNNK